MLRVNPITLVCIVQLNVVGQVEGNEGDWGLLYTSIRMLTFVLAWQNSQDQEWNLSQVR